MPVLRQIFDAKGKYRKCVLADIGRHYERIAQWIPDFEKLPFQQRMKESIEEGKAWCTENAFLYYTKEDARIAHGTAMFGMSHPTEFLALLIGIFSFEDHDTHIMRFKLHPGKDIQEYKALLTVTSIKRTHNNPDHPLLIRVDAFRNKCIKAFDKAGIKP